MSTDFAMSWEQQSNFEGAGGWTPTFAEEYSVFNATPGRLTQRTFTAESPQQPISPLNQEGHLSGGGDIGTGLGLQTQDLSPTLPPHSAQLSISPEKRRVYEGVKTPKRPKKRLEEAFSGQTVTPPQSSKGSRKLAPKILDSRDSMQQGTSTHAQQPNLTVFATSTTDLFGYPMSAPATAPTFTNSKPFWDPDASMSGMDIDFTDDAGLLTAGHRTSNSFDWGRSNQIFQDTANLPQNESTQETLKRHRPLAKKSLPITEPHTSLPPFAYSSAPASDMSFTLDGAVDPGLLYSRTNSISKAPSNFEDVTLPAPRPATSHMTGEPYQHQLRESRRDQEELRRSRSSREISAGYNWERGTVSSPVKGSARPGLQRSVSDGRKFKGKMRPVNASLL